MGRAHSLGQPVKTASTAALDAIAFGGLVLVWLVSSELAVRPAFAEEAASPVLEMVGPEENFQPIQGTVRRIAPGWISPDLNVSEFRRGRSREPLSPLASPATRQAMQQRMEARSSDQDWEWRRVFRPSIVAANRIKAGLYTLSMEGVVAPDIGDRCMAGSKRCGVIARASVRRWVRARAITCLLPPASRNADTAERKDTVLQTKCRLAGEDVATWLVAHGWAIPETEAGTAKRSVKTGDESARPGAADLVQLSRKARLSGLGLFGLGGWMPGEGCGSAAGSDCIQTSEVDPVVHLPTPKWTFPVATILPPPNMTDAGLPDNNDASSAPSPSSSADAFQ